MQIKGRQELLRIYINDSDQHDGTLLYKVLVAEARKQGLAGCTVIGPTEGFGTSRIVHDARWEGTFTDLPVVIEIVDRPEKIETLLPFLDKILKTGLVTRETVQVEIYRADAGGASR